MREVAVGGAVAVPGAIAVNPEVVVPLQIVRLHRIDQRGHLSEDPLARRGAGDADLPDTRVAVVVTVFGEPALVHTGRSDVGQVDAFGLDPEAEVHPQAVGVVGQRLEAGGEAIGIRFPGAEAGIEVEGVGRACAGVPAGVEHEELDPHGCGTVHLVAHRRVVDLGAVREPRVVRHERRQRASVAHAVEDIRA